MKLRDWVAANLTRSAVVVRDTLDAILKSTSDNGRRMVDFADDEDGRDDAGNEALEDNGLVVVDGDLGPIVGERDGVRRWRWIFRLRRWGRRCIDTTRGLVDVDDVHDERICCGTVIR